jgi:hypothetical protein
MPSICFSLNVGFLPSWRIERRTVARLDGLSRFRLYDACQAGGMMVAYRIDADFNISWVEDEIAEMDARGWDWDCLDYSDHDDVWCNDRGLFEADPVLAWIGPARRIPLPAYIRGADGEDSCDPHVAITDVRFGPERELSK